MFLAKAELIILFLQLGVHGYAFLNTNNGYILSHPDLRPLVRIAVEILADLGTPASRDDPDFSCFIDIRALGT